MLTGHEEFTIRVTHELLRMNQALLILGSLLDTSTSVDSGKRCPKILPEDVLIPELAVDHRRFQPPTGGTGCDWSWLVHMNGWVYELL